MPTFDPDYRDSFDASESERLKNSGMELAAEPKNELLKIARDCASAVALAGNGTCNADKVAQRMGWLGYSLDELGPAAGSIFKGKDWEFTGDRVNSKRITNHARELKVWRLVNNPMEMR
tara:strand:- start:508 stop:864 length:357 start_codon:yes stop_codon:yes gene_type:complete